MLLAVIRDLQKANDVSVSTIWDARLGEFPLNGVNAVVVPSFNESLIAYRDLLQAADYTLVIAPEFGSVLQIACEWARKESNSQLLGPTAPAIAACSDKLELPGLLGSGVPMIATKAAPIDQPPFDFPIVLKPFDGAGSIGVRLVESLDEYQAHVRNAKNLPVSYEFRKQAFVAQPFQSGQPMSVGVIVSLDRTCRTVLPIAEQHLSNDGQFKYQGGKIPADINSDADARERLVQIVARILDRHPGLVGYFGIDLLFEPESRQWHVVEINPRITTSFLGYSRASKTSLLASVLPSYPSNLELDFTTGPITFTPNDVTLDDMNGHP